MNKNQKKYILVTSSILTAAIILFAIVIQLNKSYFLIDSKKPPDESSKPIDSQKPSDKSSKIIGDLPDLPENPQPNLPFTSIVPVKFKTNTYKEMISHDGDAFAPKVSPDGRQIVFIQKLKSKTGLAIVDLLKSDIEPIDLGLDDYSHPSWNFDGTKVVFSGVKGSHYEIYVYDLKNRKLMQLTNSPDRKKYWPSFSPYMFGEHYRILYVSEEKGRKDIWWVRETGDADQPLTLPPNRVNEYRNSEVWKEFEPPKNFITRGGDFPEWSPSGNLVIYKTEDGKYGAIEYDYREWWKAISFDFPTVKGMLTWSPNQCSLLVYDSEEKSCHFASKGTPQKKRLLSDKHLTSPPAFFPDGKGLAYTHLRNGKSILSTEPLDDPMGDVVGLWMYPYKKSQMDQLRENQLLFFYRNYNQIYEIYESESYSEGEHKKPYLVTSDAVLETFYIAFSSLLSYAERVEFADALTEFASKGFETAKKKKAPKEIENFFLIGLTLIRPEGSKNIPPEVKEEVAKIKGASGSGESLFGKKLFYDDFLIRGKYERDEDLRKYFQALKWFQTFRFNLKKEKDRKWVAEILNVITSPEVYSPIERINNVLKDMIGESRYYGPLTLKKLSKEASLPAVRPTLPWIEIKDLFQLFPVFYTLDAFVFDELVTHTDRKETVGTRENPRVLPFGMDMMAAFGSEEAKKILLDELKEGRFENYEKRLNELMNKINNFSQNVWDQNLYNIWLDTLSTLLKNPYPNAPDFTHSRAWKRKQLNTALGSWVNLRYETIGYVEQVGAEAGEGGYERLSIGLPRGYVEPNPLFFKKLNDGFQRIAKEFGGMIKNVELRKAVLERIERYRNHLKILEKIAQKEVDNIPLTDDEYREILYIGRTIEHFILIMNSINSNRKQEGGLANPDSIKKVVDVQKFRDNSSVLILYEALGPANEINVIVPYYGRRQVVKGPVYSYYEFRSPEVWKNDRWRQQFEQSKTGTQPLPVWIKDYYE
jgi:Tol biopolymer transport system component